VKRLRKYGMTLVATTSLVTVVLLVTGWGSAVAAQVTSVFITNTGASQAVPVQAVGTVPVHEQGTANVNVTNTTVPVHEQGTAAVRSGNEEVSVHDQIENGTGNSCIDNSVYTVPAGKELVLEYIAAQNSGGATSVFGHFGTSTLALLPLVFEQQVPGIFSASESIHFVVPSSVSLRFTGFEAGNSSCLFFASLGGYLQPNP
jgi:hypothetical protein